MAWNTYIPFQNVYVKVLAFKEMTSGGDVLRRWCPQDDVTFVTEYLSKQDLMDPRELSGLFYSMRHSKKCPFMSYRMGPHLTETLPAP